MTHEERYPHVTRRVQNFINEYAAGRFCKVVRLGGETYLVNFEKDNCTDGEWFFNGENISNKYSSGEGHRVVAASNANTLNQKTGRKVLRLPTNLDPDTNFLFLENDFWLADDLWDERDKQQLTITLMKNDQGEAVIKRQFVHQESILNIMDINRKSDEVSWKKIATMLYHICVGTYGEDFNETIEGTFFNKLKNLSSL